MVRVLLGIWRQFAVNLILQMCVSVSCFNIWIAVAKPANDLVPPKPGKVVKVE
jgi:hypothetical protein